VIPVDVYISGCPPRPEAILHGVVKAIEKLERLERGAA
jgi:membrane-bound hydrogenase subunit mbhJ